MRARKKISGLAISTILLAIVLMAAIAVTIAMSSRASNGSSSTQQDRLAASVILDQASNIKRDFDRLVANGADMNNIAFKCSIDNSCATGIIPQIPPAYGIMDTAVSWQYRGNDDGYGPPNIMLNGIGTQDGADYTISLLTIRAGVCAQINQLIYGSPTIPQFASGGDGSVYNWNWGARAIDLRTDPATVNKEEGCFVTSNDPGTFVYYKVLADEWLALDGGA